MVICVNNVTMRSRKFFLYLCIVIVFLCTFLLLFCNRISSPQNTNSMTEPKWLQESSSNFAERQRKAVSLLTPDLAWLGKLGKEALGTIPVHFPNCSRSVFLTILVASAPDNFEQRNAIRSSWAKLHHSAKSKSVFTGLLGSYEPDHVVKTVFLLGRSTTSEVQALVNREMEIFDDIVFGEFEDKYKNLVYKTRLGLTWAYSKCQSAYVLKTDDDVFINLYQLLRWIARSEERNFYTGWCNYRSKVSRNKLSKWYVSLEDYSEDEFPPYCLGGGYLLSQDILSHIIKPMYKKRVIHLEDIFIGVLINELNIQPINNRKRFNLLFSGNRKLCDFLHVLLLHPVKTSEIMSLHLQADLARKICQ